MKNKNKSSFQRGIALFFAISLVVAFIILGFVFVATKIL